MLSKTNKAPAGRYTDVTKKKQEGAIYTPKILADFLAQKIIEKAEFLTKKKRIRVLDPAIGDGELLNSILELLTKNPRLKIEVCGFEKDSVALNSAEDRLKQKFPSMNIHFQEADFLKYVIENFASNGQQSLFKSLESPKYDLIIANPPYVRTQILGRAQAQVLARLFHLSGRVDLYYAFLIGMAQVLKPHGVAGIIVSNRFMTTKSGATVRKVILENFNLRQVWDLGDTKLFSSAVLPAVLLVEGHRSDSREVPGFTSIYESTDAPVTNAEDPIKALSCEGIIKINDGRCFRVQYGKLDRSGPKDTVWRIATAVSDKWLSTVNANTWGRFRDIGKVRVGVKTCSDKVFIRSDWQDMPASEVPELLRPLSTHHIARHYKALETEKPRKILYPHEMVQGRCQPINLSLYPRSRSYLEKHRGTLEGRKYVIEAGRKWYEIWVSQNPSMWEAPKLIFRDITEKPMFWIDLNGSVVNGDCYWLICDKPDQTDLLWLALAVGNSTFIEAFYDHFFHNKLYSGRRRFMTQYVEQFPLPNPLEAYSKVIIDKAKEIYSSIGTALEEPLIVDIDHLVWKAFGLPVKKVAR